MAELAKSDAASFFKEIDEVKSWINDSLCDLHDAYFLSGKLQAWQYEGESSLFEGRCEEIIMHTEFISDIYAKHNVIELFKPFNDEIENYFKVKRDEMSAFALCVDMPC